MSWLKDTAGRRAPITIDNTPNATALEDVTIVIPPDWDEFWENVQTDGDDVIVTASDGRTVLSFDLLGFDVPTRTGTIEIDGLVVTANRKSLVWLYFDDSTATDLKTPFVPAAPITGEIFLDQSGSLRVVHRREPPGGTTPVQEFHKNPGETVDLYWAVDARLTRRRSQNEASDRFEEFDHITNVLVLLGGVNQAGLAVQAGTAFIVDPDGMMWVRTRHTAGVDPVDYTVVLQFETSDTQVLMGRVIMKVRDPSE